MASAAHDPFAILEAANMHARVREVAADEEEELARYKAVVWDAFWKAVIASPRPLTLVRDAGELTALQRSCTTFQREASAEDTLMRDTVYGPPVLKRIAEMLLHHIFFIGNPELLPNVVPPPAIDSAERVYLPTDFLTVSRRPYEGAVCFNIRYLPLLADDWIGYKPLKRETDIYIYNL